MAAVYTPSTPWITPPECQGQIVEVSYAVDTESGVILERATDRSDGEVTVVAYRWPGTGYDFWEPQNGAPRLGRRIGLCQIEED